MNEELLRELIYQLSRIADVLEARQRHDWPRTPEGTPICPKHGEAMSQRSKQNDTWFSHSVIDPATGEKLYCRGYPTKNGPGWYVETGEPATTHATKRPSPTPPVQVSRLPTQRPNPPSPASQAKPSTQRPNPQHPPAPPQLPKPISLAQPPAPPARPTAGAKPQPPAAPQPTATPANSPTRRPLPAGYDHHQANEELFG